MNYLSTEEIAKMWGISRKTVSNLASSGKIEGAVFVGNRWMIPDNAKKHTDARRKENKDNTIKETDEVSFSFPIYLYKDFYNIKQTLKTKDEIDLYKAQELYNDMEFNKSYEAHKRILNRTSDIYIKIGCLYMLCYISITLSKFKEHLNFQRMLEELFNNSFPYKKEMELLLYEAKALYKGNEKLLNNSFDSDYLYHEEVFPLLVVEDAYRTLYNSLSNNGVTNLNSLELLCQRLQSNKSYLLLVRTHLFLSSIYYVLKDINKFKRHVIEAYKTGSKYNCLYGFSLSYTLAPKVIDQVLSEINVALPQNIKEYALIQQKNQTALLKYLSKSVNAFDFNKEDVIFISLASSNHTNKEIAKIMNISESTVANHFNKLYNKFGVNNKNELVKEMLNVINKY